MAQPAVNISATITPDTRQLERQSAEAVARGVRTGIKDGFNQLNLGETNKGFRDATRYVQSFDRELDRANRRLLSFAAAGTVVYGTARALRELVSAGMEVEKSLVAVNSIFRLSMRDLDSFGKTLFNIARETSQSFGIVAKAAEEFSRQGLSATETAKRTRDALILVRLTGLDAAKAVQGLTSVMQTFKDTGIDTTTVINKLVAADDAFAVSAGGLIEAFTRVGSTVTDAGASLDQFIGLVTAARQITGRTEAVIGNSLKTIFTRFERSSTVEQLENMGFNLRKLSGEAKNGYEIFQTVAKGFSNLTKEQQNFVAELGAGVYQINQFRALVKDIGGGEDGISSQATLVAEKARNNAILRNEAMNRSMDAMVQRLKVNLTEVSDVLTDKMLGPGLERGLGIGMALTNWAQRIKSEGAKTGEDVGAYFGEKILEGLGSFLAGPGIIFLTRGIMGLGTRVIRDASRDFGETIKVPTDTFGRMGRAFGLKRETEDLSTVNSLLAQATTTEQKRVMAAQTLAEKEAAILSILERQVIAQQKLAGATFGAATVTRGRPRAAEGYIPIREEASAIARGVGGAPASARPVYLPGFNRGGGQRGIVANTSEWIVPGAAGGAIFNRDMIQKFGLPPGSKPVAAGGFIPNAAGGSLKSAMEIALGKSPNAPISSYEAAVRRWSGASQNVSGATADINAMFRGMGSVLPYGPQMTPDFAAKLEKLQAAEQARKNKDFERAKEEIAVKERAEAAAAALKAKQMAEMNAILDKEQEVANKKAKLSATDLRSSIEVAKAVQSIYENARIRGEELVKQLRAAKSAQEAKIVTGERKVFEIRGIPDAPYQFDNSGILTAGGAPSKAAIPANIGRSRVLSDAERIRKVYRQQIVEERQASRNDEIIAQNKRLDSLRERLQAEAQRTQENRRLRAEQEETAKRVKAEMDQMRKAQERAARLERFGNRAQMGGALLSMGAGFVPTGMGGTAAGMAYGGLSGGMQGLGMGAALGGTFGPMGAIIGAAVGGVAGGVGGLINKSRKSFEEVAAQIEESNARIKQQISDATNVFNLDDELRELRSSVKTSVEEIKGAANEEARIRRQIVMAIASQDDPAIRKLLLNRNDPNVSPALMRQQINTISSARAVDSSVKEGLVLSGLKLQGSFMNNLMGGAKMGVSETEKTANPIMAALAGLSESQITAFESLAKSSPRRALESLARTSKMTPGQIEDMMGAPSAFDLALESYSILDPSNPITNLINIFRTKNEEAQQSRFGQAIQKALNDLGGAGLRGTKPTQEGGGLTAYQRRNMANILERRLTRGQIDQQSLMEIMQARQQADMSNPFFSEMERVGLSAALGKRRVEAEVGFERQQTMLKGIMQMQGTADELKLGANVKRVIQSLPTTDASGLLALRNPEQAAKMGLSGSDVQALDPVIEKLILSMRDLDYEERKRIATIEEIQQIEEELIRKRRSRIGAEEEDTGALKTAIDELDGSIARNDDSSIILQRQLDVLVAQNRGRVRGGGMTELQSDIGILEKQMINDQIAARRRNAAIIGLAQQGGGLVTGTQLQGAMMGDAQMAGQKGDAKGSFAGGFRSVFAGMKQDMMDLSAMGASLADSLNNNLGNAFGNFVVGAERGKDAFRSFVVSVLGDAARALASKAVAQLLSFAFSAFLGSSAAPTGAASTPYASGNSFLSGATVFAGPGSASGGYISRAAGGVIPAEVMKGEFIYGPAAAKRIGTSALNAINTGTFQQRASGGALVTGGSGYKDDVRLGLPEGSFVVRKAMVEKYGLPMLSGMASGGMAVSIGSSVVDTPLVGMAMGGLASSSRASATSLPSMGMAVSINPSTVDIPFAGMAAGGLAGVSALTPSLVRGYSGGGGTSSVTAMPIPLGGGAGSGGNVSVNTVVTVNDNRTSATSDISGDAGLADKQVAAGLARQIEQITRQTLVKETRVGGLLRIQSLRGST